MVHARDLKFHMYIPNEKIVDPYFFHELFSFSELCPFENKICKTCVQDISKSI